MGPICQQLMIGDKRQQSNLTLALQCQQQQRRWIY